MPDIPAITHDYLWACVERDLALLQRVSLALEPVLKRKVDRVRDFADGKVEAPCWWLYPGDVQNARAGGGLHQQIYQVNLRFIIGVGAYDGSLARALWQVIPTVTNYFNTHKSLCYQDGQDPPPMLDVNASGLVLTTPFGTFADNNDVGCEWQQTLVFNVYLDSEDGFS